MTARVYFLAPMRRFPPATARDFGEVRFLYDDVSDVSPMSEGCATELHERLVDSGYTPGTDAIALSGPLATVALLAAAAAMLGPLNVLVFDAREGGKYRLRRTTLGVAS